MLPIKFGTDGWRAIIAKDFTFDNCQIVAQGIANYLNNSKLNKKGIVIGYDNRFMSREFANECARVLVGNGIKVLLFKRAVPTPVTAFATRMRETGGAIMITASHNPPEYNGIKFIPEHAGPAMPEVTEAIESEINKVLNGGKIYRLNLKEAFNLDILEKIDIDQQYLNHIAKIVKTEYFKEKDMKVVVNPMYGAGIGYLDKILNDLGCEVKTINNYRDVLFGGAMPEPINPILTDLKRAVLSYNANVGLAVDGDADRFGIVDNQGEFISANRIIYLLLDHLLKTRSFRGPVCRSTGTTHMLDRVARRNGVEVIETPVGFKYIGDAIRQKGCIFGAEESGGVSVFGHIPGKDGILACLLVVEMLAYSGRTLAELTKEFEAEYGSVISERVDIQVNDSQRKKIADVLADYQPNAINGIKVESNSIAEGRKIVLKDGSWVLIRSSGTEPVFRIYLEANNEEVLQGIKTEVLKAFGI